MSCNKECFACSDTQIKEKAHAFVERLLTNRYPWMPDMIGACQRMKEAVWGEWMTRKPDGLILGDGWTFARDWKKRMKEAKAMEETAAGNELGLIVKDSKIVVSSRDVARVFEKEHKDVLKSIRELGSDEEFNRRNFAPVEYRDAKGEMRPEYLITRDGFTILAMGYTGEKAMAFKIAYIKAFNLMESALQGGSGTFKEDPLLSHLKAQVLERESRVKATYAYIALIEKGDGIMTVENKRTLCHEAAKMLAGRDVLGPYAAMTKAMDIVQRFIMERCVVRPGLIVSRKVLNDALKAWCEVKGIVPPSSTTATRAVRAMGYEEGTIIAGARRWTGIALQENARLRVVSNA